MPANHESDENADALIDTARQGSPEARAALATGLPAVSPDLAEEELGDEIDNLVPTRGYHTLPVVALGGSAGSIPALRKFFEHTPADSGLAYLVVLHLAPEHESTMPALIQRHAVIPVRTAEDAGRLEPNTVYVIPPGQHLMVVDGHLRLTERQAEHGKRVAVDLCFRSLADTHGPHSTAVVLSGADGDGAIGLKRIKERGGLTIAQDPEEAEHGGMPTSAIDTGMVDWILHAEEIPGRILAYYQRAARVQLPPEEGPQPAKAVETAPDQSEMLLREVLTLLRARTGRDFSYYKRATIVRRIARRMQVSGKETLAEYLSHLRTHPGEAGALLQDLLISVTNFFRDREAFATVEAHIPEIFRNRKPGETVRVWCAACATGEEAYSMAMLLLEEARKIDDPPTLQVFGCDLDDAAIQIARAGFYPDTIAADVSDERLRRFFVKEPGGYRVRRELREMVLFASHDLLKDAPFSRMDLISCRNLLIYLNREAQRHALEIFNFALKPRGLLFLGASETVEEGSTLFTPLDKKHRLYRHRTAPRIGLPVPTDLAEGAIARVVRQHEQLKSTQTTLPGRGFLPTVPPLPQERGPVGGAPSANELHFRLLGRFGPPSIVVNAEHDIMHLSEKANHFLQFPEGEPTRNLLRLIHPTLRLELRAALLRAVETGEPTGIFHHLVNLPGGLRAVDVTVSPAGETAPGYLLVVFEEHDPGEPETADAPVQRGALEPAAVVQQLERELTRASAHLRDTVEQYEASSEELKASNEELQAMNEELRSAGEELETGREELQSVNEELTTVNTEFKSRVEELGRTNSDLHNLMNATQIATVFLDRELHIMRYTPSAAPLFNLIASDVGRPIAHLKHQLDYSELEADARHVLHTLVPAERELRDNEGRVYLARTLPYRTVEDHIAGVVLSFTDITARQRAEEASRASEAKYRTLFDSIDEGFCTFDMIFDDAGTPVDYRFVEYNPAFERHTGLTGALGRTIREFLPDQDQHWFDVYGRVAMTGEPIRVTRYGEALKRWIEVYAFRIDAPERRRVAAIFSDVTARKVAETNLQASEERQAYLLKLSDALRPLKNSIAIQETAMKVLGEHLGVHRAFYGELQDDGDTLNIGPGYSHEVSPLIGYVKFTEFDSNLLESYRLGHTVVINDLYTDVQLSAKARAAFESIHVRAAAGVALVKNGEVRAIVSLHQSTPRRWLETEISLLEETADRTWAAVERSRAEETLRAALQEAEQARGEAVAAGAAKDHFLAVLSHELRTPLMPINMALAVIDRQPGVSDAVRQTHAMIRRNVELETRFIDDMLDVTRISRGKMEIVRVDMDLHEAIRQAVEVSKADIEAKKQRLSITMELPECHLSGDFARLQQVFWNLLKNASKFTPEGGSIAIHSSCPPGEIHRVEVTDTGIGMEADVVERIFRPFEQANVEITREFGGLGLGLAIAKATVEAHGGTLRASSPGPGQGSTFTVNLPTA